MESSNQVLITSVFSIPKLPRISPLSSRRSPANTKAVNSPRISHHKCTSRFSLENSRNKKQEESSRNRLIFEHFKDKLYEDVTLQTLLKLKHKISFHDKSLLEKVVHMKKFISFWKCFCDYANPIISIEKFKNESKIINERHPKDFPQIEIQELKYRPTLYTNSLIFAYNHKKKREEDEDFYKKNRK